MNSTGPEPNVRYRSLARPLIELIHSHNLPAHVEVLRPPTFEQLRQHLRAKPSFYHVLHFDGHGATETTVPKMSHEMLVEMVGTTRSRICFFMNRFKDSGFIYHKNKIKLLRVHRTLLAFSGQSFPLLETSTLGPVLTPAHHLVPL